MSFDHLLAPRTRNIKASAIRALLKVAKQPGMISLGGGYPAPESFPLNILNDLTASVLEKYGTKALQYDATEGFRPLREALVTFLQEKQIYTTLEQVLVTSGSQGFLDAIGKVLISKGDRIAIEAPTYVGALQAFNAYEPEYICMATDENGLIPDSLEEVLASEKIKFIYLVPTFQNPTGNTLSLERRKRIAEIIQTHNALLIEDDPYSDLRFRGTLVPAIKTMAPDNVIYISTLSKIFAPGLRIGFFIAPDWIIKWMVRVKQGVDLHTSTFNQALAAEYISAGYLKKQLSKIIAIYKPRQEAMLQAMDNYFPEGFTWSKPEGGMFIWIKGPKGMDMEDLFLKSVERNVIFVPGKFFFTRKEEGLETLRLNYSNVNEEKIESAVKILSEVIKTEWDFE